MRSILSRKAEIFSRGERNEDIEYDDVRDLIKSTFREVPEDVLLYGIPLDNFFVGAREEKLTSLLKKRVKKCIQNVRSLSEEFAKAKLKVLDSMFPEFGNELKKFYSPRLGVSVYWGDKENIGEGEWEKERTCFAYGGQNEPCKHFIVRHRRVQVLVMKNKEGVARCLVYFKGNGQIELSNFYFNKISERKDFFIEGIKKLLNIKEFFIISNEESNRHSLPVYSNQDAIYLYVKNKDIPHKNPVWKCSECGRRVEERYMQINDEFEFVYLCVDCKKHYCHNCNNEINLDEAIDIGGNLYCDNCVSFCEECGEAVEHGTLNHVWVSECNGKESHVCNDCYNNEVKQCEECGESFLNLGDGFCNDCYNELEEEEGEDDEEGVVRDVGNGAIGRGVPIE